MARNLIQPTKKTPRRTKAREVLVLIDLQEGFSPLPTRLIKAVKEQIAAARASRSIILTVEKVGCGRTLKSILTVLKDYPYRSIQKRLEGGGEEILVELKRLKVKPKLIKVCGIYTNLCVAETVGEVARRSDVKIEVMAAACRGTTRGMHLLGLKDMLGYNNVKEK